MVSKKAKGKFWFNYATFDITKHISYIVDLFTLDQTISSVSDASSVSNDKKVTFLTI